MTYQRTESNVRVSQGNESITLSPSGVIFRHSNRNPVPAEARALMIRLVCDDMKRWD
jgi:hypothetical protein